MTVGVVIVQAVRDKLIWPPRKRSFINNPAERVVHAEQMARLIQRLNGENLPPMQPFTRRRSGLSASSRTEADTARRDLFKSREVCEGANKRPLSLDSCVFLSVYLLATTTYLLTPTLLSPAASSHQLYRPAFSAQRAPLSG